jgi:hypothetical protein
MSTKFSLGSLKGRDHSEDLGVDGRIILKLILGNRVEECVLEQGPEAGSFEYGNENLGFIRGREFWD